MSAEFDDPDFLSGATSAPNLDRPAGRDVSGDNARPKVVQPTPQALPQRQGPSAILVSTRQKGNPILNHVKSLPWEYSDIPCDYVLGATTCALFLSLKYHRLHPEYIYGRIRQLGKLYNLRILLTMVDIDNHEQVLQELSKTSMINNLTLILAWSAQEAGRYIELFKSYEHANPASIRARQAESWAESVKEFITTPRNINKTDAVQLMSNFGSLQAAVNAEPEQLALIPGWGEKKVKSWHTTVREPFRTKRSGKANAHLLRHDSTVNSADGSESATPEPSTMTSIPIGRIPANLSRENSRPQFADQSTNAPGQKRQRLEEITFDDDVNIDDENALRAAEETSKNNTTSKMSTELNDSAKKSSTGPELSAGVAAALAKYRSS